MAYDYCIVMYIDVFSFSVVIIKHEKYRCKTGFVRMLQKVR